MIDPRGRGNYGGMGESSLAFPGTVPVTPATMPKPGERAQALVNEHFDFVWRLLRRLGVPAADVDDAAQQVFIVAARRLAEIAEGKERTFLYGTALRTAGTVRRNTRRRERWIEGSPPDVPTDSLSPHEQLEHQQALAFLDRVLQALDEREREVFVLCQIEELSAPHVASLLEIPVGTVASRLRRAREAFANELKRLKAQER